MIIYFHQVCVNLGQISIKILLKTITILLFFCRKCVADVGPSWNHTEICWGNMLLLLQHCSKIKTIWFFCNVAATPFYVASSNNLETTLGHLHLFLALSTQHITLQEPEKSFKSLLRLSNNVNCQNVLLWFTFVLIGCVQQLPGKDILVHNQRQKHYKTRVIYVLQNDTYLQMETPFT